MGNGNRGVMYRNSKWHEFISMYYWYSSGPKIRVVYVVQGFKSISGMSVSIILVSLDLESMYKKNQKMVRFRCDVKYMKPRGTLT